MQAVEAKIRIRYEETDRMGVAYYANYLVWFEVGRTELLRAIGLPYREMEEKHRCILPVVEAFCKYRRFVGYDEEITIKTAIKEAKRRGITFEYNLYRDEELVAQGYTKHVVIDPQGKVRSFPEEIYKTLARIADGGNKT